MFKFSEKGNVIMFSSDSSSVIIFTLSVVGIGLKIKGFFKKDK